MVYVDKCPMCGKDCEAFLKMPHYLDYGPKYGGESCNVLLLECIDCKIVFTDWKAPQFLDEKAMRKVNLKSKDNCWYWDAPKPKQPPFIFR